jgi:predicted dehydrogenase
MNKKLTAAVVGLGNIGLGYDLKHRRNYVLTHTKALRTHKGFQLLFGVDVRKEARAAFTKFAKRPAFASLKDAAKAFPQVDVISVCVGLDHRQLILKDVVSLRPRAVILEKPMAATVEQARQLVKFFKDHRIALCVNYPRRFDATTKALLNHIRSKTMGKLLSVDVFYNGGFYNNASHFIDLLCFLLGQPSGNRTLARQTSDKDHAIDGLLKFGPVTAFLRNVPVDCPVGEVSFWFERGRIQYKKFGLEMVYSKMQKDQVFGQYQELAYAGVKVTRLPYVMRDVVENVYGFLTGKTPLLSNGETALKTLAICERIRKSS